MGVMTGGAYNAVTAKRTQAEGSAVIVNRATQAETEQDATIVDDAINVAEDEALQAIEDFSGELGGASEDLSLMLQDEGIPLDTAGTTGEVEILDPSMFAASLAQYPPADVETCNCIVMKVAEASGVPMDALTIQNGMTTCLADPKATLANAAAGGVNVEACKPWYLRKQTMIIGGVVLGGVVLLRMRK
jgi:hypothetical protein